MRQSYIICYPSHLLVLVMEHGALCMVCKQPAPEPYPQPRCHIIKENSAKIQKKTQRTETKAATVFQSPAHAHAHVFLWSQACVCNFPLRCQASVWPHSYCNDGGMLPC